MSAEDEIKADNKAFNEYLNKGNKPLPPLIQKLADGINKKGLKISFGLEQQGHIATIERMLNEFGSATSEYVWEKIGKEIGWSPNTAACYYIEYLRTKQNIIYSIRKLEGLDAGKIWGSSFDTEKLIEAFVKDMRSKYDFFKDKSDKHAWEVVEKAGEFEIIQANFIK